MHKINYYSDSFKFFVGIVEDVLDEAYVKVRCFGIHPLDKTLVTTEQLPPALVSYPTTGGQVASGALSHNLEVDSWVWGVFVDYPLCMQPMVIGVVQGTDYSMSTYGSQGGEFVGEGSQQYTEQGDPIDPESVPAINIPGGSNIEKTYNYVYDKLVREGSSSNPHLHTAALLGVLMLETPNVNPAVVGGYKGRAWGICQWLGSRREQLFRKYGRTKRLDHQLDFMWWELNNTERRAKGKWLRATNLADAVAGFAALERAEEWQNGRINRNHPNFGKRLRFAYQIYQNGKFTGNRAVATNAQ